jgi:hypothetical protein
VTRDEKPEPGKVYSITALAEGKSLDDAEVTSDNPHPSDIEKKLVRERTQPPAQLPLPSQFDSEGARMRRDSKRADARHEIEAEIEARTDFTGG